MAERNYPAIGSKVLHCLTGVTGIYKGLTGSKPQRAALVAMDMEYRQKYAEQIKGSIDEVHSILVLRKDLQVLSE